jgi:hypothetical protein
MSQHDYNIANQGFPATRADLNNALAALASTSSGVAAPTTTYANQFWYDTTNNLLMFRNADNDAWITFAYLDQATDEWEIRTAVIQAVDAAGLTFKTDEGTARVTIDDVGNLGLGTVSPTNPLHILSTEANQIVLESNSTTVGPNIVFQNTDGHLARIASAETNTLRFEVGPSDTEAMRLDASGNLLVGKTISDATTTGFEAQGNGQTIIGRANGTPLKVNRLSSDGPIAQFRRDGTNVGELGNFSTNLYIGTPNNALVAFGTNRVYPANNDGTARDNAIDLGNTNARFDDIFATNGTIQTSDRNEKQDIAELSDAEQRVAVAAKGLLRKFRWKDAVAEKGDEARTHFGIIAQDLQAAFAAEGLDAGDYAMFISTTWWETQTEVPAVEAVAEVLDDDGNVVTEAVEAVDAYTRTDTYETQEEAPEGATERTRLGVRYSELLAFIIAAI